MEREQPLLTDVALGQGWALITAGELLNKF